MSERVSEERLRSWEARAEAARRDYDLNEFLFYLADLLSLISDLRQARAERDALRAEVERLQGLLRCAITFGPPRER
jgi:hypothetical protein